MASSSGKHQQLVRLYQYGSLSLPALSFLALITGFTLSLSPPSCLQALLPAVESLFLVSLPQLWRASLSWITPPCLFVLLNGIIMILTATSGRPSSSRDAVNPEMEPNLANQIEIVPFKQNAVRLVHDLAEPSPPISSITTTLNEALQMGSPLDMHTPLAQQAELESLMDQVPSHDNNGEDAKQLVLHTSPQDASALVLTDNMYPEHDATTDNSTSSSSSSSSLPSEENVVKAGSEPSSPHSLSSPVAKNNIRRSMSIDSVAFIDNGEVATSEQLSEEAFKKRIDDFILKMNFKFRNETRVRN